MKLRARMVVAACVTATAVFTMPPIAGAQGRRAVPVVRSRSVVVVGAYRPFFYDPWYFNPWYFSPYYQPYPPYPYGFRYGDSSLRVQVTPRETEVFIDGYYAGTVDEFDGFFQRLHIEPGEHEVELYLPGYRSVQRKIYLQPGSTFRLRHSMEALAAGEANPTRPIAKPLPQPDPSSRPVPRRPRDHASNIQAGFGTLALRVQPGEAVVTIDGEPWEGAPDDERLVIQLGAGVHRVEIRKEGYRTYSTDVRVQSGETTTLNVALTGQ